LQDYIINNRLPRHPLVAKGYPSIGCAPCTSPVKPGEDPRAGRWRGKAKTECGIHFANGKFTRTQQKDAA
jgi:phosphoadenosine phosphosulfate reductase